MIGRLLEDGFFVARFAWHYYKAPDANFKVGFTQSSEQMPAKNRIAYAYRRAIGPQR